MKFGGTQTRKYLEVVNEMRLVEVATCCCNIRPIGRGAALRQVKSALKTLNATKLLRCDTDLIGEYPDKVPLAQPEMRGKGSNLRFARISSKDLQGSPNCSMFSYRVLQASDERAFQNAEAPGWICSREELFAQILRKSSPKRFQIHMSVGDLTSRNAQEAKRTAGFEMHAHDVRPSIDEKRPRMRPADPEKHCSPAGGCLNPSSSYRG